jgi:hypothetical protein
MQLAVNIPNVPNPIQQALLFQHIIQEATHFLFIREFIPRLIHIFYI